ncbi:cytochrome b [Pleionea sediminis]|uniref:cytochrome b n=1 Tax=Pleionea sediminis TaxID=2569479 RepID=UPI0011849BFC|nr:cytochrome b [Pleionea sediminis]
MIKNTQQQYGLISKVIHWLVALVVFTMFGVGLWMVELDYYSTWYKDAPHYHKSVGILLTVVIIFRLVWRWFNVKPEPLKSHSRFERIAAHIAHIIIYVLLFAIFISGYLISTADGRGISVFNWFEVPSLGQFVENQEDLAGEIHELLAFGLIGLVAIHALAALKHHFFDKDSTLKRMF